MGMKPLSMDGGKAAKANEQAAQRAKQEAEAERARKAELPERLAKYVSGPACCKQVHYLNLNHANLRLLATVRCLGCHIRLQALACPTNY